MENKKYLSLNLMTDHKEGKEFTEELHDKMISDIIKVIEKHDCECISFSKLLTEEEMEHLTT